MPLIKCIDCGTDVSSYAQSCPKCGCPVHMSIDTGKSEKLFDVVISNIHNSDKDWIVGFIRTTRQVDVNESRNIVNSPPFVAIEGVGIDVASKTKEILENEGCTVILPESNVTEELFSIAMLKETHLYKKYQPLKCPRCGSAAVTTTSRGYSLLTGFLGSNKTVNRCGKCGHTWKP